MIKLEVKENIVLRELQKTDAEIFAQHANNKNIWDRLRDQLPFPYTVDHALRFIEFCDQQTVKSNFTISINQAACGMIGCGVFKNEYRVTAEFGYWLSEEFWGQGIMSDCIPVFTNYVFSNFEIERMQAPVYEFNLTSMRVLEKSGFSLESVMRRSAIKNNKVIDQYLFVKFREGK